MLKRIKMPSSYTPSQKSAISQFVGFTQVKDSLAAKVKLALHDFTLNVTS